MHSLKIHQNENVKLVEENAHVNFDLGDEVNQVNCGTKVEEIKDKVK